MAIVQQLLHNVNDRVHGLGRAGVHGRPADAEPLRIDVVFLDIAVRDNVEVHAFFIRLIDDLIVDIGEVLHKFHLVAPVLKVAAQQVEYNERARIADVEVVIHGRAAGIHFDLTWGDRNEFLLLAGQGIEQFHDSISFSDLFATLLSD